MWAWGPTLNSLAAIAWPWKWSAPSPGPGRSPSKPWPSFEFAIDNPIAYSDRFTSGLAGLVFGAAPVRLVYCRCSFENQAPVAQLDRSTVFRTVGWGFESLRA